MGPTTSLALAQLSHDCKKSRLHGDKETTGVCSVSSKVWHSGQG